jgi:hypothetical protein
MVDRMIDGTALMHKDLSKVRSELPKTYSGRSEQWIMMKPKSKKKTAQEPSASPERSPVRDSEYEVQRKARLAQNADCLSSLEVAKIPARAQAAKKESAPQVCPREPALFCGRFDSTRGVPWRAGRRLSSRRE